MFERFTDRAKQVVVLAQSEARSLRHGYIGTEHLLLGILGESTGIGARTLARFEVTLEATRSDVVRIIGRGSGAAEERDAEALRAIGIDLGEVRRRVEEAFGPGALDRPQEISGRCGPIPRLLPGGHIPFTPRAKKVLELSLREALALGHKYIGTEHILLGLVREGEGVGAKILHDRGVSGRLVRRAVTEELAPGA
jgi:ATP-dependent Clp protease ATP-binding subunit ClpA